MKSTGTGRGEVVTAGLLQILQGRGDDSPDAHVRHACHSRELMTRLASSSVHSALFTAVCIAHLTVRKEQISHGATLIDSLRKHIDLVRLTPQ
ncbi:hypothetical protein ACHAXS_009284 [Conticribra weissflogii]